MKTVFKLLGCSLITLVILSVEVNNRPIFLHIYHYISPMIKFAQTKTSQFFNQSMDRTSSYSKKIFDNSVPRIGQKLQAKSSPQFQSPPAQEDIHHNEKAELEQLIKTHR
jgi:hypothetical protein